MFDNFQGALPDFDSWVVYRLLDPGKNWKTDCSRKVEGDVVVVNVHIYREN
jgi:hypothetical protein